MEDHVQNAMNAPAEVEKRFRHAEALFVAQKFVAYLARHCRRIEIAGSLRRRQPFVSDIEILFVPRLTSITDFGDMFGAKTQISQAGVAIDALIAAELIAKRPNKLGHLTWGAENRLAVHVESGIPVDFFATTEANWWNALVVRTGPAASNKAIASAAIARDWRWNAYGSGFTRDHRQKTASSEQDVFEFVGLPYLPPEKR